MINLSQQMTEGTPPNAYLSVWAKGELAASGGPEYSNWAQVAISGSKGCLTTVLSSLESHAGPSKALSEGTIYILSCKSTIDICTPG